MNLTVPQLADSCAVDLILEQNLQRVACATRGERRFDLEEPLQAALKSGVARVLGTGRAVTGHDDASNGSPRAAPAHVLGEARKPSYVCMPLRAREQVIGVLTLVRAERPFQRAEVQLIEQLASRASDRHRQCTSVRRSGARRPYARRRARHRVS